MTTDDFLRALEATRDRYFWSLVPDRTGGLYKERRKHPRLHLRASSRFDHSLQLDPLRAVCYATTGQLLLSGSRADAIRALGMTTPAAADILASASDRTWANIDGTRVPVVRLLILRNQMLEAVGLEQEVTEVETETVGPSRIGNA